MPLTHEKYAETEAKLLWNTIVAHMESMNRSPGRRVGIAVASLDYLSNIKNELSDLIIIEERKSNFVAGATTKDELTGLYVLEVFDVILKKKSMRPTGLALHYASSFSILIILEG